VGGEMNIEQLVCSREWGEKLKEVGVPQKSKFWWLTHSANDKWKMIVDEKSKMNFDDPMFSYCSAYLTDELLWWLPARLGGFTSTPLWSDNGMLEIFKPIDMNLFAVKYINVRLTSDPTLPNACAAMLDYLIKEGLVEVEDLK
jgi:hypothetical protein